MLKQTISSIAILISISFVNGCSQSDGNSTSDTATGGEVINGHILPPEPDPDVNNATLLGVDVNNNGVRDDVERWIYKRYDGEEHQKTKTAIALQYARATQIIIQEPEKAYEQKTYELMDRAQDCKWYWKIKNKLPYEETIIFDNKMADMIFNTKERLLRYAKYNSALGGHIYKNTKKSLQDCDENIDLFVK